ncbi:MAG: alpha/beta fold hydrolase [archaeon]
MDDMQIPVKFKNREGLVLRGFVHKPKRYDTAVIVLHGFPGSCNGHSAPPAARMLERAGFLALRFSFSGSPPSDGRFEDKLMSKEADDIKYAIDFLEKNYLFKRLVLFGHSTGAIDAALYAHRDKRIDRLILTGGSGNLKEAVRYDFTDEQVRDFWSKGYMTYHRIGKWTYGKKLKKAFYDEFFRLDVLGSLHKFRKPVLIVHGGNDEAVRPDKDPYELYNAANKPKRLVIIKGSDHSFSKPRHRAQLAHYVLRFIREK